MTAVGMAENDMRRQIMAIMMDTTMSDEEKARKRQELLMGTWSKPSEPKDDAKASAGSPSKGTSKARAAEASGDAGAGGSGGALDENLKCGVCLNMCERPVTAPCQHNFCLGCFRKWTNQGKRSCPSCRAPFPSKFAENPRINTALTFAIRLAKNPIKTAGPAKEYKRIDNEKRPDQAFTTDNAKRSGRANAASGRIMVTIPNDHFGPITAEHDPERGQGVLVGEWWKDRLDCRQWGAHFPHVAGIAGQSGVGAQSVVLSGGYEDDRDEGEWFLYTGSGGRDLSGNKRTNKVQSFDQEFDNMNKALMMSCVKGLPVRVVRSFKEKRSSYAPTTDTPVRYDGVYRILRCWRKPGNQGPLVCRYLFVRCDNAPAPWSSGETGDDKNLDIPDEAAEELKAAKGKVYEMCDDPMWDYLESDGRWGWAKEAPVSQRLPGGGTRNPAKPGTKLRKKVSEHEKALREFQCGVCKSVCEAPLSTPCGHNFCKGCLDKRFEGISDIVAPTSSRTLRVRKNLKPCPKCNADLCDFLSNAQVNREMVGVIATLQREVEQAKAEAAKLAASGVGGGEQDQDGDEDGDGDGAREDEDEAGPGGSGAAGMSSAAAAVEARAVSDSGSDGDDGGGGEPSHASPGGLDASGPSDAAAPGTSSAAAAAPSAAGAPQPAPAAQAPPKEKYADELAGLAGEFPDADVGLMRCLLEDQGGDVADVRVMVKKMMAPTRKPAAKKPTAKKGGAAGSSGGKRAAGGKKRGRPAKKAPAARSGTPDSDDAVEEQQAAAADDDNDSDDPIETDGSDSDGSEQPRGKRAKN